MNIFGWTLIRNYDLSEMEAYNARQSEKIRQLESMLSNERGKLSMCRDSKDLFERFVNKMIEGQMADPAKLGIAFASESDHNQAKFLNTIGETMRSWGVSNADMQSSYIFDKLSENGMWLINLWHGWAQYRFVEGEQE